MHIEIDLKHLVNAFRKAIIEEGTNVPRGYIVTVDLLENPEVERAAITVLNHAFKVAINPPNPFIMKPLDILEILHRGLYSMFDKGELKVPMIHHAKVEVVITLEVRGNPYRVFNTGIRDEEAAHTQSIVNFMNQWRDCGEVISLGESEPRTTLPNFNRTMGSPSKFINLYGLENRPMLKEYTDA